VIAAALSVKAAIVPERLRGASLLTSFWSRLNGWVDPSTCYLVKCRGMREMLAGRVTENDVVTLLHADYMLLQHGGQIAQFAVEGEIERHIVDKQRRRCGRDVIADCIPTSIRVSSSAARSPVSGSRSFTIAGKRKRDTSPLHRLSRSQCRQKACAVTP
jgi:hypothetical protein